MMRAATYTQGGAFEVREVPDPSAGPGELLLRIRATALCGTDVKIVRNGHRKLQDGQCIVLGHELVGDIVEVGRGVEGYALGERVGVAPNAGCGQCRACAAGEANYCAAYTAFGIDRDGSHADLMRVPAPFIEQGNVQRLPETVSDLNAALLEPLSCVVNALDAVQVGPGDRVLVYGVGPMGLLHVMACRDRGAARVTAIDPQPDRLRRAVELGATEGLNPERDDVTRAVSDLTQGDGADVAITACPIAEVQAAALARLAVHGRLCLFGGLPRGSAGVPLDTNAIHYRHLTVTGTTGGANMHYRTAVQCVAEGRIDPSVIVSDTFALDELEAAYAAACRGAEGKVVLIREDDAGKKGQPDESHTQA